MDDDVLMNSMMNEISIFVDTEHKRGKGISDINTAHSVLIETLKITKEKLNLNCINELESEEETNTMVLLSLVLSFTVTFILKTIQEEKGSEVIEIGRELIENLEAKELDQNVYVVNYKNEIVVPVPQQWNEVFIKTILQKKIRKSMPDLTSKDINKLLSI